jgi:hypothetical protein
VLWVEGLALLIQIFRGADKWGSFLLIAICGGVAVKSRGCNRRSFVRVRDLHEVIIVIVIVIVGTVLGALAAVAGV